MFCDLRLRMPKFIGRRVAASLVASCALDGAGFPMLLHVKFEPPRAKSLAVGAGWGETLREDV